MLRKRTFYGKYVSVSLLVAVKKPMLCPFCGENGQVRMSFVVSCVFWMCMVLFLSFSVTMGKFVRRSLCVCMCIVLFSFSVGMGKPVCHFCAFGCALFCPF